MRLLGDMLAPGYAKPLNPEFLKFHPMLVLDTKHFDACFIARMLESLGEIDEKLNRCAVP